MCHNKLQAILKSLSLLFPFNHNYLVAFFQDLQDDCVATDDMSHVSDPVGSTAISSNITVDSGQTCKLLSIA